MMLEKEKRTFQGGIDFSAYYREWIRNYKHHVSENTYDAYYLTAIKHILPYFDNKKILIQSLQTEDLKAYYDLKISQGLSINTVHHHHANIHRALKTAKEKKIIQQNPAADISFPKYQRFHGDFYTLSEIETCIEVFAGHELEACVWFAIIFGLRRSEILGLKWENINLIDRLFAIKNTVVTSYDAQKKKSKILNKNNTKNQSSRRILPLTEFMYTYLHNLWIKRGKPTGNVPVILKSNNEIMLPDYISRHFKAQIEKCGLRSIRFHDLRHSCATMLRRMGYNMQDIQKWLGHSTIETTAKYYAHYDINDKIVVSKGLDDYFGDKTN